MRFRAVVVGLGRVSAAVSLALSGREETEEFEASGAAAATSFVSKRDGGSGFACDDDDGDGDRGKNGGGAKEGGKEEGKEEKGGGRDVSQATFASVQLRTHLRYSSYEIPLRDCVLACCGAEFARRRDGFRYIWSRLPYAEVEALALRATRPVQMGVSVAGICLR